MLVIDLANEMERWSSSSDVDGCNSTLSNFLKLAFLWKQLKPIYNSGGVSPLVDFDGVCNMRDNFFRMFFANKSWFVFRRIN